jgi:hypothetical protein
LRCASSADVSPGSAGAAAQPAKIEGQLVT